MPPSSFLRPFQNNDAQRPHGGPCRPGQPQGMARRKVGQSLSVVLTALVACADCVDLLAPSPASGLMPCGGILWANPTPGASGVASCRCGSFPAWPSQLVRQGLPGPPRFRAPPSAHATLSNPGKPSMPSPRAGVSILGSRMKTPSPLAARTFEAELLKQDAGPESLTRTMCSSCTSIGRSSGNIATMRGCGWPCSKTVA
jgi:hypothetical protein